MLIASEYIRFCAEKTSHIVAAYDSAYGSAIDGRFWRSADELHTVMMARHEKPIYHRKLNTHWRDAKYRSFYIPYPDRYEIWYADQLPGDYLRFYKTKELLQIELWQQSVVTSDIPELVRNMILRESPASVDLDLGRPATSDTLGEIAAAQFLFPLDHRVAYLKGAQDQNGVSKLAAKYAIPAFLVQRALSHVSSLAPFFAAT